MVDLCLKHAGTKFEKESWKRIRCIAVPKVQEDASREFVPKAWMDAFVAIGDIMGPEDWITCEDLIEMVRAMKAKVGGKEGEGA